MKEIIFSGFGGQGVLTAGLIAINIGVADKKIVSWSPSYGSEMRGGTANCNVIISEEEIGSPAIQKPDILVAMNEPSVDKFEKTIKKGGIMLLNSTIIPKDRKFRDDIDVYFVDATNIANHMDNSRGANIVMLGALTKCSGLFTKDVALNAMNKYFDDKGKNFPQNTQCFEEGFNKVGK